MSPRQTQLTTDRTPGSAAPRGFPLPKLHATGNLCLWLASICNESRVPNPIEFCDCLLNCRALRGRDTIANTHRRTPHLSLTKMTRGAPM